MVYLKSLVETKTSYSDDYTNIFTKQPPVVLTDVADNALKLSAENVKRSSNYKLGFRIGLVVSFIIVGYTIYRGVKDYNAKLAELAVHPGRLDFEKVMKVAQEQRICPCKLWDKMSTPDLQEYLKIWAKPQDITLPVLTTIGIGFIATYLDKASKRARVSAKQEYQNAFTSLKRKYEQIQNMRSIQEPPVKDACGRAEIALTNSGINAGDAAHLIDIFRGTVLAS